MINLSLRLSPQLFTTMIVDGFNRGAILIASAKACEGSREGEMSSNFVTSL